MKLDLIYREKIPSLYIKEENPPEKRRRPVKNVPKQPKEPGIPEQQAAEEAQSTIDRLNKARARSGNKNSEGHPERIQAASGCF
jgi:hypothetical protein